MAHTVFTNFLSPKNINQTTGLRRYGFVSSHIRIGIITNEEII